MGPKDADGMANSVDHDQIAASSRSSLIWVCTICPDLSFLKLRDATKNEIKYLNIGEN